MNRRTFLKQAASVAAGVVATRPLNVLRAFAGLSGTDSLSLSVMTDMPDLALARIESLLKYAALNLGNLQFEEALLPGNHMADIVLLRNNMLMNYKQEDTAFARSIRDFSKELKLPRRLDDPVFVTVSTGGGALSSRAANVYQQNRLVAQIELTQNRENIEIAGKRGQMVFAVRDGRLGVEHAACKHKTCMKMGRIHKPDQHIVCIPNQIRVAVVGKNELGLDGVAF